MAVPKSVRKSDNTPLLTITVQEEVGIVTSGGDESPMLVAFRLVGGHFIESPRGGETHHYHIFDERGWTIKVDVTDADMSEAEVTEAM